MVGSARFWEDKLRTKTAHSRKTIERATTVVPSHWGGGGGGGGGEGEGGEKEGRGRGEKIDILTGSEILLFR